MTPRVKKKEETGGRKTNAQAKTTTKDGSDDMDSYETWPNTAKTSIKTVLRKRGAHKRNENNWFRLCMLGPLGHDYFRLGARPASFLPVPLLSLGLLATPLARSCQY